MYYSDCAGARTGTVTRTPQNVRTVRCADRTPKSGVRLFTIMNGALGILGMYNVSQTNLANLK